jgi:hypothetical protein
LTDKTVSAPERRQASGGEADLHQFIHSNLLTSKQNPFNPYITVDRDVIHPQSSTLIPQLLTT